MSRYVALGDSISIDLYPELEASARGITATGLGAASLFHRNVDELWPELAGQDLTSRWPGIVLDNHTSDGAMISTVSGQQLGALAGAEEVKIATLTVGGNDLLGAISKSAQGMPVLLAEVARHEDAYARLIEKLRARLPHALLVIGTIYDPTDGTGFLWPDAPRLPIELLKQFNEHIRAVVRATGGAVLADLHTHFLGHGVHAPPHARWYWEPNPIEPSMRGASEVRRVLWNASG